MEFVVLVAEVLQESCTEAEDQFVPGRCGWELLELLLLARVACWDLT